MRHNLLSEPLIQTDAGWYSLSGLMAAMTRGEVLAFPAMRPHQRPAWHMFLVQLATLGLDAIGWQELPASEADWAAALRALTPDDPDDAPWHLVVEDRSRPAFMQPPEPGGLKWSDVPTPDALDMLITSRNHDIKAHIAQQAAPQDWVFALVSVQTMEGYGGAGNHGIARMNGGASSRAMLTLAPLDDPAKPIDPSCWWARDVQRLLEARAGLSGKALVWTEPWPEGSALTLDALDPLFIEICRRLRLTERDGSIVGKRTTSKSARISAKDAHGAVNHGGDPWAPIFTDGKSAKTLTLGERDWSYRLLVELLHGVEWHKPLLARPSASEESQPMAVVAEAFARGNSKTDGFRSRLIPIPKDAVQELFETKAVDLAKAQIEDIASVDKALRAGLSLVATEGDYEKREQSGKNPASRRKLENLIAGPLASFDHFADQNFFPALWAQMRAQTDEARAQARLDFIRRLAHAAEEEFRLALPAIPCARLMRPRAELRGLRELRSGLRRAVKKIDAEEDLYVAEPI